MIDKMYWVCADLLSLGAQVATAQELPPVEILQRKIDGLLEQMSQKGRELGIPEADVREARYALIAFLDEQILRSPWPGRQQWMAQPLQYIYYKENTLGEGFFQHMDAVSRQPERAHVFEVYYLCLALGFQGIYAVRGDYDSLAAMTDRGSAWLARHLQSPDNISPHGEVSDVGRRGARAALPIVAMAVGCLALSVLIYIGLRTFVWWAASDTATEVKTLTGKTDPPR